MLTIDTSTLIAFFAGHDGKDVQAMDQALKDGVVLLTPPVLAEMLSDPKLPTKIENTLLELPRIEITEGFWIRVAKLRKKILAKKMRARLADAMIAQCCIDHALFLITRDSDFKSLARYSSLKIL